MDKRRSKKPSKFTRRNDKNSASKNSEMSSKKSKARDKKATPLQVVRKKSDAPTVAIAPSDYEHIYHAGAEPLVPNVPANKIKPLQTLKGKSPNVPSPLVRKKSDAPTVAIAPSDYEHIYHAGAEPLVPNVPKKREPQTVPSPLSRKKSDAPTVAIAPSDYEHIYHAGAEQLVPNVPKREPTQIAPSPLSRKKSDAPTVAIAPSDYEHIYHAGAEPLVPNVPQKREPAQIGPSPLSRKKSDAPTVAIAPSDYEHIYHAGAEPLVPNVPKKETPQTAPLLRKKSDAPTVAIAPSDYEHIFHAGAEPLVPNVPAKKETFSRKIGSVGVAPLGRKKSDAPTVAIAPSDYEHIYHAGAEPLVPNVPPKREPANLERKKSDAPTVAIAPSDYEHIFHAGAEQLVPNIPRKEDSKRELKKDISMAKIKSPVQITTPDYDTANTQQIQPKPDSSRSYRISQRTTQEEFTTTAEKQQAIMQTETQIQPTVYKSGPKVDSKKTVPASAYRDGISEQVKDIVKKFSFNRPREYTIKSRVPKPKK